MQTIQKKIFKYVAKDRLRDASRLALQSAFSAAFVFMLMQAWGMPEKFVGVLSAVLVLKVSVGGSWGQAWERFAATLLGCLVGALCLLALPNGYGTAVALAVSMLVMNAIAGIRPEWRYGVVAAVALALGAENNLWQTSLDRSLSIGLGVLVGAVVSAVVWPEKASSRAARHLRSALYLISEYLQYAMNQMYTDEEEEDFNRFTNKYSSVISASRSAAAQVRIADNSHLNEQIQAVDRLYYSVTIIKRIAENTDSIDRGDKGARSVLQEIADICCDFTKRLSEEESIESTTINQLKNKARELRRRFKEQDTQEGKDTATRVTASIHRNALLFAMTEIEKGLSKLIELQSSPEGKS